MITIYKYPLSCGLSHEDIVTAPIIKPLRVDRQHDCYHLWALVDTDAAPEEWLVTMVGTGWDVGVIQEPVDLDTFVNTTVGSSAPYVWHWFCRRYIQSMDL